MTAVLALALLARQEPAPAPTLPTGVSVDFAKLTLAVEARLQEGDAAAAGQAARALPSATPRIAWTDEDLLTPELLKARKESFSSIVAAWKQKSQAFAPVFAADSPDLTIGFAKVLPDGLDGLPMETKIEPGYPFRATIGLSRGKPGVPLRPEELAMEVAYVLGRYLGVSDTPYPGSAMYRDARPGLLASPPTRYDAGVAAQNLSLADRLRAAVAAGKPLGLVPPSVSLVRPKMDLGEVRQGDPLHTEVEVENHGSGTLDYGITPDCNCFLPIRPGKVAPLGRARIPMTIHTDEYTGRIDKSFLFVSNDPDRPVIEVPVTFRVRPAYRLFHPGGEEVVVPDAGAAYDFYFFPGKGQSIAPVSARWEGFDATVTQPEPWAGTLADGDMEEGPLPRKGWRIRVRVASRLPPGRCPGTLTVETDSDKFHNLMVSLYAYKGIVAQPESVPLGDIEPGARASLLISRPGVPFKVLGVKAGPSFKTSWISRRNGSEYRIDVEYKGGAAKGDLLVPIRIQTDDPKQPLIEAMARGNVK